MSNADGSCLMTHDPYDMEHGSAFLWSGSLSWTLWINKEKNRLHTGGEKDRGGSLLLTLRMPDAIKCNATHPFLRTSREIKFTRPFPFLFCVAGEDEFFKVRLQILYILISYM